MVIMISNIKKFFFLILFSSFLPNSLLARDLVIKSLGHSSFLINSADKSILINPFKAIGCASNLKEPKEVNVDFIWLVLGFQMKDITLMIN